jgi:hypothetical protein
VIARLDRHELLENGRSRARSKLDIQWPNDHTRDMRDDRADIATIRDRQETTP